MKRTTRWWVPSISITILYMVRRILLTAVEFKADSFIPYKPSFAFASTIFANFELPRWMYSAANFDGAHYLAIAETGYQKINFVQAFFPVFPIFFIRPFFQFFHNDTIALLFVLNAVKVCFVLFMIAFFYLVAKQISRRIAWFSIFTILVFPTSIFFGALYTESLFMLLVTLTFLCAAYKRWWMAGLFALVAGATRIIGVALIPALLVDLWITYNKQSLPITKLKMKKFMQAHWQHMIAIGIGTLGLFAYMTYLQQNFHDALYFEHIQQIFGAGRQSSVVLYPQVVWRSIKILITARPFDVKYYAYVQEFIASTVGLVILLCAARKVRASYTLFALLSFFIPTLTGTFSSMPRYILACFPLYIVMGMYFAKRPKLFLVWAAFSICWLTINALLFAQGYWVA